MHRQVSRWFFRLLGVATLVAVLVGCSDDAGSSAQFLMVDAEPAGPTATALPTTEPVALPTAAPTSLPTAVPTALPTVEPTAVPAPEPTALPTALPTAIPAAAPAADPTAVPTALPTVEPTAVPAPEPTAEPTALPTVEPTAEPAAVPTEPAAEAPGAGGPPADHVVTDVGYVRLGQAGGVWLSLPAARIELIGFHEAGHPGSQQINAAGTGVAMMVLDSRSRGTSASSAADIVIPPGEPVRSPVTGTVTAANSYILYCEHQDRLVYIEPDGLPGWQVRVFHVEGPLPEVGTRVIAGETVIASGANLLPFESQVDEFTAEPSWAHVHVEVVDTSVPDTRPPGPGCP